MEFRWIELNRDRIAAHGVTESEAEYVVEHARPPYPQWRADDKLLVWGATPPRKAMSKATRSKPSTALTPQELDRMAAEFEREFVADTFGPPPPAVRARLRRAKRKRGRPRTGAGSQAISVTIEKTLLAQVDALVRRSNTPRAQLITRGLRFILAAHKHSGRRPHSASKPKLTATAR